MMDSKFLLLLKALWLVARDRTCVYCLRVKDKAKKIIQDGKIIKKGKTTVKHVKGLFKFFVPLVGFVISFLLMSASRLKRQTL